MMTATNIGLIIDAGCHFPPRFLGELMAIHPSTNQPTNKSRVPYRLGGDSLSSINTLHHPCIRTTSKYSSI